MRGLREGVLVSFFTGDRLGVTWQLKAALSLVSFIVDERLGVTSQLKACAGAESGESQSGKVSG